MYSFMTISLFLKYKLSFAINFVSQNIKLVEIMSVVILRTIKHFLNHKYFLIMTNTQNE